MKPLFSFPYENSALSFFDILRYIIERKKKQSEISAFYSLWSKKMKKS